LKISEEDYKRVNKMIKEDCEFLEEKQIIDYSLLIGIYEKERAMSKKINKFCRRRGIAKEKQNSRENILTHQKKEIIEKKQHCQSHQDQTRPN